MIRGVSATAWSAFGPARNISGSDRVEPVDRIGFREEYPTHYRGKTKKRRGSVRHQPEAEYVDCPQTGTIISIFC